MSCPASVNSRKDKSLRVMSQKFVMLFLVSNPRVVSLDVAAKILIGEDQCVDQDKNKFKSEYNTRISVIGRVGKTDISASLPTHRLPSV